MAKNEYYHWYRDHGLCPRCKKKAPEGRALCLECAAIERERARARKDQQTIAQSERRRKRKEMGLCIDCGAPAMEGRSVCKRCNDRRRRYYREVVKARRDRENRKAKRIETIPASGEDQQRKEDHHPKAVSF